MKWDDSLACGIPAIDEEHKDLIARVVALGDGNDPGLTREMLGFLGDYVIKHFTHEQVMHKRSGFPEAHQHKIMHDRFISVYTALKKEYDERENGAEVLEKLVRVCWIWLKEHIMGMDRQFAEFYKGRRETVRAYVNEGQPG